MKLPAGLLRADGHFRAHRSKFWGPGHTDALRYFRAVLRTKGKIKSEAMNDFSWWLFFETTVYKKKWVIPKKKMDEAKMKAERIHKAISRISKTKPQDLRFVILGSFVDHSEAEAYLAESSMKKWKMDLPIESIKKLTVIILETGHVKVSKVLKKASSRATKESVINWLYIASDLPMKEITAIRKKYL